MKDIWITPQALKWTVRTAAILFVVMAMLATAVALIDGNHFRAPLIRFIAARTGRRIRMAGAFETQLWSLTPRVMAERVAIGNPPWMPAGTTAEIGRLSLSFELLPLFCGSFVISRLEMDGATLHLERDSAGRANWQSHEPGKGVFKGPPLIHSLSMPDAHLHLEDSRRHLRFEGTVSAQDVPGTGSVHPLRIAGTGQLNGRPVTFAIAGDPLATVKRQQIYHFGFSERSSDSHLIGRGVLPQPFDFRTLDASFDAVGEDLEDLYFLVGVTLPDTGAYHLSGKLARRGTHFQYSDLMTTSGQSDMRGTLSIETSGDRPKLAVDLSSQRLRLADLGARAAGRLTEPPVGKPLLLPDTPLRLSGIRRSDAVVNFNARRLDAGRLVLHAAVARVTIDHGVLTVAPVSAAFIEGKIAGRIRFDATNPVPMVDLDVRVSDLRLGQFNRKDTELPPLDGLLQARVTLTGRGNSIHQLAATSNGTVTAVLPHGAIRASFAELAGIDVSRALGLMLTKDRKETSVRCGVASFKMDDGKLTEQSLVIDTDSVLISGAGNIDLDSEALDLAIRGRPKSWRLVRLRSPLLVRGTLAQPSIGLDARHSLAQTGEAIALGIVLTPLAAILAFVDPGLAKDADCAALLAQAKENGPR